MENTFARDSPANPRHPPPSAPRLFQLPPVIMIPALTMTVAALRKELEVRGLDSRGLKAQLVGRLQPALDAEASGMASMMAPAVRETRRGVGCRVLGRRVSGVAEGAWVLGYRVQGQP